MSSGALSQAAWAKAERELERAVDRAVRDFLHAVADRAASEAVTASGVPPEPGFASAWRRAVQRVVAPVVGRLWGRGYRHVAGDRQGDGDQAVRDRRAFVDGVAERTRPFPARVAAAVRATATRARGRNEAGARHEARRAVAAVLAAPSWAGQVRVIARTEAAAALNAGTLAAALYRQDTSGVPWVKTWVARDDARTRPAHEAADGQVRPLGDRFDVGDARLLHPGDPAGPPGQIFNCRCVMVVRPLTADSFAAAPCDRDGAPPMHAETERETFRFLMPESLTAAGEDAGTITVDEGGQWSGPIGMVDEWSADFRRLSLQDADEVDTRPLPLPVLVQWNLAPGHEGAELGLMRMDRVWYDGGGLVMGEGAIDMQDPAGVRLAGKIRDKFLRFVSMDVDSALGRTVCVDWGGDVIPGCDPELDDGRYGDIQPGRIYDTWRVMGATLLAHPAFPQAAISMTGPTDRAAGAAGATEATEAPTLADEPGPAAEPSGEDAGLVAAGLVVKAADTGRVLMLQRALDEDDAAAGRWEWPGGHIEDGEAPLDAAVREWQEETGVTLPEAARVVDEWTSPDGVYRGHVAVVPSEETVPINVDPEDRQVINPDDPDGDVTETLAWWDIDALPEMPALREEVRDTPWQLLVAAGPEGEPEDMAFADGQQPEDDGTTGAAASGCVVQDETAETGWRAASCDEDGAVPGNEAGTGPADGTVADDGGAPDPSPDLDAPDETDDGQAGEGEGAGQEQPEEERVPVGEQVRAPDEAEGGGARDVGNGCVKPDEAGGWVPCPCEAEGAVTANPQGEPLEFTLAAAAGDTDGASTGTGEGAAGTIDTGEAGEGSAVVPAGGDGGRAFMSLAASAFAHPDFLPDTAWFRDPHLTEPTLVRVGEDGRIVGHLALWGVPHVAYQGRSIYAPHSPTNYDRFHMRPIRTTEGLVEVGVLAMGTDHAKPWQAAETTVSHYDSTGSIVGAVRCGEDAHGIWMAGAILPDVHPDQRLRLSLATFSGDWRNEGRGLDLKAALSVPAGHEGFYTPKNAPDDKSAYALVASGALTADHVAVAREREERAGFDERVAGVVRAELARERAGRRRTETARGAVERLRATVRTREQAVLARRVETARVGVDRLRGRLGVREPDSFAGTLEEYWKHGEGAAKIRWGTPGDWTRCHAHLTKHVGDERARRICAQWHKDVNGYWPGDSRNE